MTDAEKIELLRAKLEETLSENDKLRAELARMTEALPLTTLFPSSIETAIYLPRLGLRPLSAAWASRLRH
jgi:hypothetical protein